MVPSSGGLVNVVRWWRPNHPSVAWPGTISGAGRSQIGQLSRILPRPIIRAASASISHLAGRSPVTRASIGRLAHAQVVKVASVSHMVRAHPNQNPLRLTGFIRRARDSSRSAQRLIRRLTMRIRPLAMPAGGHTPVSTVARGRVGHGQRSGSSTSCAPPRRAAASGRERRRSRASTAAESGRLSRAAPAPPASPWDRCRRVRRGIPPPSPD